MNILSKLVAALRGPAKLSISAEKARKRDQKAKRGK